MQGRRHSSRRSRLGPRCRAPWVPPFWAAPPILLPPTAAAPVRHSRLLSSDTCCLNTLRCFHTDVLTVLIRSLTCPLLREAGV